VIRIFLPTLLQFASWLAVLVGVGVGTGNWWLAVAAMGAAYSLTTPLQ
jgi:hypothetical protein